jgi:hypothetical protein
MPSPATAISLVLKNRTAVNVTTTNIISDLLDDSPTYVVAHC